MKNRTLAAVGTFVVTLALSLPANAAPGQGKGADKGKPQHPAAKSAKPAPQGKPDKPAKPVKEVKDVKEVKQAKPDKPVKPAPAVKQDKPEKPVKPVVFEVRDRDVIHGYYSKHPFKHGKLPPGLEKQLQRNGTLPPGLRGKFQPFPLALERELGPLPYGYRRGFVDDYVVVYRTGTYVIADSYWYQVR
ncbi:MAG TPA: hypothetical protein VMZ90_11730 [Vicinamibacterales bacterium]|nr:hypothetical protein [Vicinamibacterales bacterium]